MNDIECQNSSDPTLQHPCSVFFLFLTQSEEMLTTQESILGRIDEASSYFRNFHFNIEYMLHVLSWREESRLNSLFRQVAERLWKIRPHKSAEK